MEDDMMKRAAIAGASSALKYKDVHPNASESEIMSHVTKELHKIISEIDED